MSQSSGAPLHTSKECSSISIKVAANRHERHGAFHLSYNAYLRAGLCDECEQGLRITPYQLLPTTDIIVAELRGEVISTISLVRDGELGLPLESLYPEEVAERRAAGRHLAEVSCLADRRREAARYFGLFCELAQVMVQMAQRDGIDELLIAVHPRHARLYARAMGFRQIGELREYGAVNGHPAVLMSLDLALVKARHPDVWARFVGDVLPDEITQPRPIDDHDREHFADVVQSFEQVGGEEDEAVFDHPGHLRRGHLAAAGLLTA